MSNISKCATQRINKNVPEFDLVGMPGVLTGLPELFVNKCSSTRICTYLSFESFSLCFFIKLRAFLPERLSESPYRLGDGDGSLLLPLSFSPDSFLVPPRRFLCLSDSNPDSSMRWLAGVATTNDRICQIQRRFRPNWTVHLLDCAIL